MPTKQHEQPQTNPENQPPDKRAAVIADSVLHALGQPGHLYRVQVRPLWLDHYRVNVLVGLDIISAKIAHSYFLVADSNGKILGSTPKITRQY